MTDMVERVARAIGDAYETAGQRGHLRTMRPSEAVLKIVARVAIAAMREPSEGMVAAMNDEITNGVRTEGYSDENQYGVYEPNGEAAPWRAAIDAALKGDKP